MLQVKSDLRRRYGPFLVPAFLFAGDTVFGSLAHSLCRNTQYMMCAFGCVAARVPVADAMLANISVNVTMVVIVGIVLDLLFVSC